MMLPLCLTLLPSFHASDPPSPPLPHPLPFPIPSPSPSPPRLHPPVNRINVAARSRPRALLLLQLSLLPQVLDLDVREMVSVLDLDVLFYPCPVDGPTYRPKAIEMGGKRQFPYMVDPNTGVSMYESDEIIKYLANTYGNGSIPLMLQLGPITSITAGLAGIGRMMKGSRYVPAKMPPQPLEVWAYEPSPFCKLVREALCELELPHIYHATPRGSPKREALKKRIGRFQAVRNSSTERTMGQCLCSLSQLPTFLLTLPLPFPLPSPSPSIHLPVPPPLSPQFPSFPPTPSLSIPLLSPTPSPSGCAQTICRTAARGKKLCTAHLQNRPWQAVHAFYASLAAGHVALSDLSKTMLDNHEEIAADKRSAAEQQSVPTDFTAASSETAAAETTTVAAATGAGGGKKSSQGGKDGAWEGRSTVQLVVAYDGGAFHGYQSQQGAVTVQRQLGGAWEGRSTVQLVVAYDGGAFHGYQSQQGAVTVQRCTVQLVVAYDGGAFHGYQSQQGAVTVQRYGAVLLCGKVRWRAPFCEHHRKKQMKKAREQGGSMAWKERERRRVRWHLRLLFNHPSYLPSPCSSPPASTLDTLESALAPFCESHPKKQEKGRDRGQGGSKAWKERREKKRGVKRMEDGQEEQREEGQEKQREEGQEKRREEGHENGDLGILRVEWDKEGGLKAIRAAVVVAGRTDKGVHAAGQEEGLGVIRAAVVVAGRMDKGVHAAGQVCAFHTWKEPLDLTAVAAAVDAATDGSLRVIRISKVPRSFQPQISATTASALFLSSRSLSLPPCSSGPTLFPPSILRSLAPIPLPAAAAAVGGVRCRAAPWDGHTAVGGVRCRAAPWDGHTAVGGVRCALLPHGGSGDGHAAVGGVR
ncbi:unnamed protein product [Closterium sp. NIES-64]|nr:unnamed protein product [Closterium sp. NIES-64]